MHNKFHYQKEASLLLSQVTIFCSIFELLVVSWLLIACQVRYCCCYYYRCCKRLIQSYFVGCHGHNDFIILLNLFDGNSVITLNLSVLSYMISWDAICVNCSILYFVHLHTSCTNETNSLWIEVVLISK